jgi:rhodanese-related sulfurtransferase
MNRSFKLILVVIGSFVFLALCLGILTRVELIRSTPLTPVDIQKLKPVVATRFTALKSGYGDVSFEDAKMAFDSQDAVFIDARPLDSFKRARVPGALYLYWRDYDFVKSKLDVYSKHHLFIVYCASTECDMARRTAEMMVEDGFDRVYVLNDGIKGWAAHQGALESDYVSF